MLNTRRIKQLVHILAIGMARPRIELLTFDTLDGRSTRYSMQYHAGGGNGDELIRFKSLYNNGGYVSPVSVGSSNRKKVDRKNLRSSTSHIQLSQYNQDESDFATNFGMLCIFSVTANKGRHHHAIYSFLTGKISAKTANNNCFFQPDWNPVISLRNSRWSIT